MGLATGGVDSGRDPTRRFQARSQRDRESTDDDSALSAPTKVSWERKETVTRLTDEALVTTLRDRSTSEIREHGRINLSNIQLIQYGPLLRRRKEGLFLKVEAFDQEFTYEFPKIAEGLAFATKLEDVLLFPELKAEVTRIRSLTSLASTLKIDGSASLESGSLCVIRVGDESLYLSDGRPGRVASVPFADVVDVRISGKGLLNKGMRFGGFGLGTTVPDAMKAMVKMEIVTGVLNRMFRDMTMDCELLISTSRGAVWFQSALLNPKQLRFELLPVTSYREKPGPERTSLSEELDKLAEMHRQGVLDDEEFRTAKARLLAS